MMNPPMVRQRLFSVFVLAPVLPYGCSIGDKMSTSGSTELGSGAENGALGTSGSSTSAATTSTGGTGPGVNCEQHLTRSACEAESPECSFLDGTEVTFIDGECGVLQDDVGWCFKEYGASQTPDSYYQIDTGRVFSFAQRPDPLEGWEHCSCEPTAAPACTCTEDCGEGTTMK